MFNDFYQYNAGTQVALVQTVKTRNFRFSIVEERQLQIILNICRLTMIQN